jgi:methylenetetrahydrofolate dehydrogenase (NADP+)/methenyltetrahydrofolate cyclohydrolase
MLDEAMIQGMALRLDGKALAKAVESRLQAQIESNLPQAGRPPGLAVLRE